MAKDMLEAVYEAEQQCSKREADAKADAAKRIEQARQDAADLISKSKQKALSNAEGLYAKEKNNGELEFKSAVRAAEQQCAELSQTAEKNRSRVIDLVIKQLVG